MARHESRARQDSTETPQNKSGPDKRARKSGTGTGSHDNSPPSGSAKRSSHGKMPEHFQKEESTNTTFWALVIALTGIFLFVYTRNDKPDATAEGADMAASEQISKEILKAEEHVKEEDAKSGEAQETGAGDGEREALAEDEDLPDEIDKAAGKVLEKLDESENVANRPVSKDPTEASPRQTATPQAEGTASTKSKSQAQPAAAQPEQAAPAERTNTKASQPAKRTASSETTEKTKPVQKPAADVKSADIYNPY